MICDAEPDDFPLLAELKRAFVRWQSAELKNWLLLIKLD